TPLVARRVRHCGVDDRASPKVEEEEHEDLAEPDVVGLHEVARARDVIPQEGRPALPVAAGPRATHISLDGSLTDADAELEQLAAEALRAPARIAGGHLSDKRRTRGRGSTRRPRASAPERATACLVPAEDGRRLDEQGGVAPRRRHACCEPHREAPPRCPPDPPRDLSLRDDELLPEQGVLGDETRRGGARRRRPAPPRTEGPRSCGALYRGQRADGICSQDGPSPSSCRHGPECDAQWRRAREWVGMNTRWPIREDPTRSSTTDGVRRHPARESGITRRPRAGSLRP